MRFTSWFAASATAVMLIVGAGLRAQQPASKTPGAPRGAVKGRVVDSLSGVPLAHAVVQLARQDSVASMRSTTSDSAGRFAFADLPTGRYLLSFLHPELDSIGIEPPVHQVEVRAATTVIQDVATPSALSLRTAYCRAGNTAPEAFIGVARRADNAAPLAGVSVRAMWNEVAIGRGQIISSVHHADGLTGVSGWFILCGVPAGQIQLTASRQASRSDSLDLEMPASGFMRRDVYLPDDSSAAGAVQGTVVASDGTPIEGARISASTGGETRSAADGSWSLSGVPQGTRSLSFRAVRYFPRKQIVDVVPSQSASVRVKLEPLGNMLDTVVSKDRRTSMVAEFDKRKRTLGTGHFLTPEDLTRRNYQSVSSALREMPGLFVTDTIKMRSAFEAKRGSRNYTCSPALYVNGNLVPPFGPALTPQDVDFLMEPRDVLGIEVYTDVVPPQFQAHGAMGGCGSIVIWTK